MKNLSLLSYILLILLVSCKPSRTDKVSFYPNYPDTSLAKKDLLKDRIKEYQRFNLRNITNGINDSLEIRIWPQYSFDLFRNCYVFHFSNNEYSGYHYNSYTTPITNMDGVEMKWTDKKQLGENVFVVKQIIPKCGWKKFYDSVSFFRLTELPTQVDIKNYEPTIIRDGYGFAFEIATKNSYRFLSYRNPHSYDYSECKAITGMIEMMKRQFGQDFEWTLEEFAGK